MKIGIITYHRAKNLGAMLQTYALLTSVKKYNKDVLVVDYRNEYIENGTSTNHSPINAIKQSIKLLLSYQKNKQFSKIRDEFINRYYILSKENYNKTNIHTINEIVDTFIVGSDQVWNMKLNNNDYTYLLDFVNKDNKRYSYAASFGNSHINKETASALLRELNKYKKITVRENEGKKIISKLLQRDSDVVVDPTLLLTSEEWSKIQKIPTIKDKYIFLYLVAPSPQLIEYAQKLAKKKKCKIICFHNGYKKIKGMKNLNKMTPNEFIGYIKKAQYVLTSSFHGLCFSVIMKKQLAYSLDKNANNNNSRLITLSESLGIEGRNIDILKDIDRPIDYIKVFDRLEDKKNKSLNYIKTIVKK